MAIESPSDGVARRPTRKSLQHLLWLAIAFAALVGGYAVCEFSSGVLKRQVQLAVASRLESEIPRVSSSAIEDDAFTSKFDPAVEVVQLESVLSPEQIKGFVNQIPWQQHAEPVQAPPASSSPQPAATLQSTPESSPPATLERRVVPLKPIDAIDGSVTADGDLISISVREAPLHAVLSLLAKQQGLSIVASSDLKQPITVTLQPTTLDNALNALLAVADCTWKRRDSVIYVTSVSKETDSNPFFQGRELRVFTLNYAAAVDLEGAVAALLSPVGSVSIRQIDSKDKLKAWEQIVVEDLPPYLERVGEYLAQVDVMPRQVLVEVHILQVRLGKDRSHGVNLQTLGQIAGADVSFATTGFASDSGPGMVFQVDGSDFNSLIDCLTTTTDAKTLASPKVMVVNGQESRIQIGERLGYFVTTTTETSTLQDVNFLEVGVVLHVTPVITADGQVLMQVRPKVSTGAINPNTGLPDEETTEVETSVLVPGGKGIIIGGLIQEEDIDQQSKVNWIGDAWGVGGLFRRRVLDRERNEVIVALLPRIVSCQPCEFTREEIELERSTTRLLTPCVEDNFRPWEPRLRDASDPPAWWRNKRMKHGRYSTLFDDETQPVRLPPVQTRQHWPMP